MHVSANASSTSATVALPSPCHAARPIGQAPSHGQSFEDCQGGGLSVALWSSAGQRALQLEPHSSRYRLAVAFVLRKLGRAKEAQDLQGKAPRPEVEQGVGDH